MHWTPLKIVLAVLGAGLGLLGLIGVGVTNSACGVGGTADNVVVPVRAPAPTEIAKTESAP